MGFQPSPGPQHSGDTGASSEGCRSPPQQPISSAGCPSSFLPHSTGAGESCAHFTECPLVAMASCAPGHSLPHRSDTLAAAF